MFDGAPHISWEEETGCCSAPRGDAIFNSNSGTTGPKSPKQLKHFYKQLTKQKDLT